jgi:hypothetical protein
VYAGTLTLNESIAVHRALIEEGLLWPGSNILLRDPSLSRYATVYAQVLDPFVSLIN